MRYQMSMMQTQEWDKFSKRFGTTVCCMQKIMAAE